MKKYMGENIEGKKYIGEEYLGEKSGKTCGRSVSG